MKKVTCHLKSSGKSGTKLPVKILYMNSQSTGYIIIIDYLYSQIVSKQSRTKSLLSIIDLY